VPLERLTRTPVAALGDGSVRAMALEAYRARSAAAILVAGAVVIVGIGAERRNFLGLMT
jgi:hypothetical protein